jgi:hypothetical protein
VRGDWNIGETGVVRLVCGGYDLCSNRCYHESGRKGIPRLYFKMGQKKGFLKNNLWQKGRIAAKHVLLPPFWRI